MTREEHIRKALNDKKEYLKKNIAAHDAAEQQLFLQDAEYRAVCTKMSSLGAKTALAALSADPEMLKSLQTELTRLSDLKAQKLKKAGIKAVEYSCDKCKDTGYKDGVLCDCVKDAAKRAYISELSEKFPLSCSRFEDFKLSYYTDPAAQKRMSAVLALSKDFAENFSKSTRQNLLFMGNTGLGKTHLSLSIAGVVLEKGYDVIYGSAYNLFSKMESEHFGEHTNRFYEAVLGCDLLIIDDLGAEFVSPYIQTLVYNIVNTRILTGKPTIVNTNLSMKEIETRYTPRVASRFIGEYTAKAFMGNDVRQIKKMQEQTM